MYCPELKEAAVIAYLRGEGSLQEICRKYEIRAKRQLQDWIKEYNAQIEIEQLKHKLYLAEMERDLLKKLDEIERRDAFVK